MSGVVNTSNPYRRELPDGFDADAVSVGVTDTPVAFAAGAEADIDAYPQYSIHMSVFSCLKE